MNIEASGCVANQRGPDRRTRYLAGKALRQIIPRATLAEFAPAANRDPIAIIDETERDRIAFLLPLRRTSMAASPHAFLRGAADVMAADLATQPAPGIRAQVCGDCHLMNFGAFVSPEGHALFDVNDFDETLPDVDVTIDLRRFATSVVVAALGADKSKGAARSMARAAIQAYRLAVTELAALSPLQAWNTRMPLRDVVATLRNRVLHAAAHAATSSRGNEDDCADNFPKVTEDADGACRIEDKPPRLFHFDDNAANQFDVDGLLAAAFTNLPPHVASLLRRYCLSDIAFKAVGVGSVGTYCTIALFLSPDDEPLFLQVKEAKRSALERFGVGAWPGAQGARVVEGQRMMQAASDIFLATMRDPASQREFYMRQLKTRRLGNLTELMQRHDLLDYAKLCGRTLARAHARSADATILAGYMGKSAAFDDALASFAMLYAQQNARDYKAFCAKRDATRAPP
ncbi:MAG: DUF2252 domain-containing protein [Methylocystis sp.]|uniref:DUF2252 domain-containing protein n=1 Tax=Methylocystis sp. TaxID=1911079 RepID=UPI003D0C075D